MLLLASVVPKHRARRSRVRRRLTNRSSGPVVRTQQCWDRVALLGAAHRPLNSSVRPMTTLKRPRLTDPVKGVLYFGALGPPAGAIAYCIYTAATTSFIEFAVSHGPLAAAKMLLMMVMLFSAWSYFMGFIPAVVTGAIAGRFRQRLSKWRYCLAIGLVGAFTSSFLPLMYVRSLPKEPDYTFPAMLAISGFFAGTGVSRVFALRASA